LDALTQYRRSITLLEELHKEHPKDPYYFVLFLPLLDLGKGKEALASCERAVEVLEAALRQDSRNPRARSCLRDAFWNRAFYLHREKQYRPALAAWDRALELDDGPDRAALRQGRAHTQAMLGDHARAAAEATDLAKQKDASPQTCYELARILALSASAASEDAKLGQPEREKLVEGYAAHAVRLLGKAAGVFRTPEQRKGLKTDAELDSLRGREDFKKWLETLEKPAPPKKVK
jgi:tetratricopeptide (TPR) repeat protein